MLKIGIDFDNTIVHYDNLFYKLAFEKKLIPQEIKKCKLTIRNFLREKDLDQEFTLLQAEAYGRSIKDANPAKGSISAIRKMIAHDFKIYIISHKTKYPYKGPMYNLHSSAFEWLRKYKYFSKDGANIKESNVFFNPTKEEKIEKIRELECDYYIDDLPEILKLVKGKTVRILYDFNNQYEKFSEFNTLSSWDKIYSFIVKNGSV